MKIAVACDHAGLKQKNKIIQYLKQKGNEVIDLGTNDSNSVDYPDYAHKLCNSILDKKADLGIVICKTGIGMDMACNKVKGIRCAKPFNKSEAKLTRSHNDANVLALSAGMNFYRVKGIVKAFLNTPFSNEERHIRRIGKLDAY